MTLYPQHTGPSHIGERTECPSIHGASYMMWEDEALYPQHTGPSHIGEVAECLSIHGASLYNSGIDAVLWVY